MLSLHAQNTGFFDDVFRFRKPSKDLLFMSGIVGWRCNFGCDFVDSRKRTDRRAEVIREMRGQRSENFREKGTSPSRERSREKRERREASKNER